MKTFSMIVCEQCRQKLYNINFESYNIAKNFTVLGENLINSTESVRNGIREYRKGGSAKITAVNKNLSGFVQLTYKTLKRSTEANL